MKCAFYIVSLLYSFCLTGMDTEKSVVIPLTMETKDSPIVQLFSAMYHRNVSKALQIIELNPAVIHQQTRLPYNQHTTTPFHMAPDKNFAKLFIKHSADVNRRNSEGRTALDSICMASSDYNDHEPYARYLVKHGADVNNVDNSGNSLLHRAIHSKFWYNWVPFLLEHGANAEKCNLQGRTPFDLTVLSKSNTLLACFEKAGLLFVRANNQNAFEGDLDVIELLKNNASQLKQINDPVNVGNALYRLAHLFMFIKRCEKNRCGNNNNNSNNGGLFSQGIVTNAYGYCFKNSSFKDLEQFVGYGAVDYVQKRLDALCREAREKITSNKDHFIAYIFRYPFVVTYDEPTKDFLCDEMVAHITDSELYEEFFPRIDDINCVDHEGNSLLHKAVPAENIPLLQFLTTFTKFKNASIFDFTKKNKAGLTALALAKEYEFTECIEVLYEGLRVSLRLIGQHHILRKKVIRFLDEECDINRKCNKGKTLFFYTVAGGNGPFWCPVLLQKGARINIQDHKKQSPLSLALESLCLISQYNPGKDTEQEAMAILTLLLQNGALVTKKMILDCNDQRIKTMLQEAYDTQQCSVCYEHPAVMGDIPCKNMHRGTFLCEDCYESIKTKNNCCPYDCGQLGAYEPFK